MEKIIIDLEAKTDKALKEIEKLNKTITETGESGKKSLKAIDESTKKTAKSTNILSKGFKGMGLALKGLGLGIAVKLVDKLSEAFESNQQIVDIMNTAFETISIVIKQVTDIFSDVLTKVSEATGGFDALSKVIGGTLSIAVNLIAGTIQTVVLGVQKAQLAWENSFFGNGDPKEIKRLNLAITETQERLLKTGENIKNSGKDIANNFLEAVGEVGSLASGVAEAVTEVIDKVDIKQANADAKRLVNTKKNFDRLAQEQQRLVEKYDLQAEQQRQIRDDESKTIAERIKANEDLGAILLKQNEAEKQTVQSRINALNEEVRLKGNTVELSNEIFELQTEMIAIDAKVAGFQSEQLTNINSLKKEQVELTKSQLESENSISIERKRFNAEQIQGELLKLEALKLIDEEEKIIEQKRLQAIIDEASIGTQAKIDAQIALDEFMEESRQTELTRDKQISDAKIKIAETEATAKTKTLGDTENALNSLGALAGEQTAAGKAIGIASATINTYRGVSDALAATTVTPFETALKFVNAGAILASGLKNVKKIASVKIPASAKGGGGSAPAGGSVGNIPSAPPSFNVVGQSDTNQLADAIGSQSKQPTKAYVVSSDVTNAQEMDRNIISGASI